MTSVGLTLVESSRDEWRGILLRDPCTYCGAPSHDVDHVHPSSTGGTNDDTNLVGACRTCNRSKGAKTFLAFLTGLPVGRPDPRFAIPPEQRRAQRRASVILYEQELLADLTERRRESARREEIFRQVYLRKAGRPDSDADKPATWRFDKGVSGERFRQLQERAA